MSTPCRESDLDALLAGELSAEESARVGAHAAACGTCAKTLAWLRLERGWMAQRARRTPPRRALSFEALEARLRPVSVPRRPRWEHAGRMALGAAAAVAFVVLSLVPQSGPTSRESLSSEEVWGDGLVSVAAVPACMDPSVEEVARVEASFGACLLASPARPMH